MISVVIVFCGDVYLRMSWHVMKRLVALLIMGLFEEETRIYRETHQRGSVFVAGVSRRIGDRWNENMAVNAISYTV